MAATAPPISESWQRIDAWLAVHAPHSLALLNPPASARELDHAAELIGVALPAELAESLIIHNGLSQWANLLPACAPLSTRGITRAWQVRTDEYDPLDYDEDDEDEHWWNPLWIPWADTGGGDLHIIDLRPGPGHGRLGMACHDDRGDFPATDLHAGLSIYLNEVAEVLERGGDVEGWYPYLTAQDTMWWSPKPDDRELNGGALRRADG